MAFKAKHGAVLLAVGGAAALFWWGTQASGGAAVQEYAEPGDRYPDFHRLGFAGSQTHLAESGPGHVLLPHRYPSGIGENITVLINSGFQALRIPRGGQFDYFLSPPGEAQL